MPHTPLPARSSTAPPLLPLKVTLVQPDLEWHQPEANRQYLEAQLTPLAGQTDLIVLPEMFTSGFTEHPEQLSGNGETLAWLQSQASRLQSAITGSLAVATGKNGEFVNRLFFVMPSGQYHTYDKIHLFRMADEHLRYQPGKDRKVIEFKGWRLLLTVCYDIRFPVFCRNQQDHSQPDHHRLEYDAMICVANWPSSRRHHWRSLLCARAIENQAYVIGSNRVGVDGQGLSYSGDSLLYDYNGQALIDGPPTAWVTTAILSGSDLHDYRQAFPAWSDADPFQLWP